MLRFAESYSCRSWFQQLQRALANQGSAPQNLAANQGAAYQPLYPVIDLLSKGSVPPAIERCISHITTYGMMGGLVAMETAISKALWDGFDAVCFSGLQVEGVYRRCGLATKVKQLVEALMTSPNSAHLEGNEQGVLDVGSALKQYVRQQKCLIPDRQLWLQAAGL